MRILVTGSRGKVGSATVDALHRRATRSRPAISAAAVFEAPPPGAPSYLQADLTDAGDAFAVVRGHDAVIHARRDPRADPQPGRTRSSRTT